PIPLADRAVRRYVWITILESTSGARVAFPAAPPCGWTPGHFAKRYSTHRFPKAASVRNQIGAGMILAKRANPTG
ncbi:MAG: hypothetical protein Q8O86_13970, partial [Dehalococcoidia bacterium]|nr:hypothetical protein [Dehalococcoidia bacterium]